MCDDSGVACTACDSLRESAVGITSFLQLLLVSESLDADRVTLACPDVFRSLYNTTHPNHQAGEGVSSNV